MYNEIKALENDISRFEISVQKLSRSINDAGMDWNDSKYVDLKNNVSRLANQSRNIIQQSHIATDAINRFMHICSED